MHRSLHVIEEDVVDTNDLARVITLPKEWTENFLRIFNKALQNQNQSRQTNGDQEPSVKREPFLIDILEDPWFEERLDEVVRVTVDNEPETLDQILERINTYQGENHEDTTQITFSKFRGFFCKRGHLRIGEELIEKELDQAEYAKQQQLSTAQKFTFIEPDDFEPEEKKQRLKYDLEKKLVWKQNIIQDIKDPKTDKVIKKAKGKFNITVPVYFEFQKEEEKKKAMAEQHKTLRQQWLEKELKKKQDDEEKHLSQRFKANEVPSTVHTRKFQKVVDRNGLEKGILVKQEQKRAKNMEKLQAESRAKSQPFAFYESDLDKQRARDLANDVVDDSMLYQFRARNIPWGILIPRFKMMMERDEHEREQRIRRYAEVSLQNAKLFPRMQAEVDRQKREAEEALIAPENNKAATATADFSFKPCRPHSVPDFRRLQKAFITKLERNKKSKNPTTPRPFKFNQARPSAKLRAHMDQQNQVINPTMAKKRSYSAAALSQPVVQPATTKKHDARVAKLRQKMEEKREEKEAEFQEIVQRQVLQNRLSTRVKESPAIVNNSDALAARSLETKRKL